MKFRIRQIPIEVVEKGIPYLTLAVKVGDKQGDIQMGPCVLEYSETLMEDKWKIVELVK